MSAPRMMASSEGGGLGSGGGVDGDPPKKPTLSFSFAKKTRVAQAKPQLLGEKEETKSVEKDYVLSIEGSNVESTKAKEEEKPLVIAAIANEWNPENILGKKKAGAPKGGVEQDSSEGTVMAVDSKPAEKDQGASESNAMTLDEEAAQALIMEAEDMDIVGEGAVEGSAGGPDAASSFAAPGLADEEKLHADIASRPDQATTEAYERIPIDKFGEAMLRGMGWAPGKPVGRNATEVIKPFEFVPRQERLGLGAAPKPMPDNNVLPDGRKRIIKPGESRAPKEDLVLARDKDGRQRSVRHLDEKLVPRDVAENKPRVGAHAEVVTGKHKGLGGIIREMIPEQQMCVIELQASHANVEVALSDIVMESMFTAPSKSFQPPPKKYGLNIRGEDREPDGEKDKSSKHRDRSRDESSSGRRDRDRDHDDKHRSDRSREAERRDRHGHRDRGERSERHRRDKDRDRDRDSGGHDRSRGREGESGDDSHRRRDKDPGSGSKASSASSRDDEGERERRKREKKERKRLQREKEKEKERSASATERPKKKEETWVARGARVRVIDKTLGEGRYYLRKGHVLDVVHGSVCVVNVDPIHHGDDPSILEDVSQSALETALPSGEGAVIVVLGEHRGRVGHMVTRDKKNKECHVRLADDGFEDEQFVRLGYDQLAEYVQDAHL